MGDRSLAVPPEEVCAHVLPATIAHNRLQCVAGDFFTRVFCFMFSVSFSHLCCFAHPVLWPHCSPSVVDNEFSTTHTKKPVVFWRGCRIFSQLIIAVIIITRNNKTFCFRCTELKQGASAWALIVYGALGWVLGGYNLCVWPVCDHKAFDIK